MMDEHTNYKKYMYQKARFIHMHMYVIANTEIDSRKSELLADSVTERCCPPIRTDIVARHTAIFHQ